MRTAGMGWSDAYDPATGAPKEVQSIEIPGVSTMAMKYRLGANGEHQVFIAGGSTGLWEIDLCDDLLTQASPAACTAQPSLIDRAGCEANFSWKRCIDVDFVEGNTGAGAEGLLLALFAASSDTQKRGSIVACGGLGDLGGTELRAYRIVANGTVVPYSSVLLSPLGTNPTGPDEEVGRALAVDPSDPDVVYVALGAGGIRKVDISTTTFVPSAIVLGLSCPLPPFPGGGTGCPAGDQVRDIAVVHTPTLGTIVYAAMELGRLAEYSLDSGGQPSVSVQPLGGYFAHKVAAIADGDEVIIAVGSQGASGIKSDTAAPARTTGVWSDMCIQVGLPNTHNLNLQPTSMVNGISFFRRNATTALAPLASQAFLALETSWNSLEFLPTASTNRMRLYASTLAGGFHGFKAVRSGALDWTLSSAWTNGHPFQGITFPAGAPTISLLDSTIGGAGFDGFGGRIGGTMFQVTTTGGVTDIRVIPKTNSVCADEDEPFIVETCSTNPLVELSDPNPFVLQSADSSAHWIDPYDPAYEWFTVGHTMYWHADPATCSWQSDATQCASLPCATTHPPGLGRGRSAWGEREIPGAMSKVGWFLSRMRIGAVPTGSLTGLDFQMRWWQVPSTNEPMGSNDKSDTAPFTTSVRDPRTVPVGPSSVPVPKFIHLVRNGAVEGIKIARTEWLMDRANASTPPYACPAGDTRGNGEPLASPADPGWGSGNELQLLSIPTHVELTLTPAPTCVNRILGPDCLGASSTYANVARNLFNIQAHVFSVPDPDQPGVVHWVLGIASGFVATAEEGTVNANCPWKDHYRRALTVFYDITDLSAVATGFATQTPPPLLGAALGPAPATGAPADSGHAFALRTQQYTTANGPRTFAYVADLLGRVLVFDVSWDRLKPALPVPSPLPGDSSKVLLTPDAIHTFPSDPFDGARPNCTDLEIDQGILYCATARAGVHLLEIHAPPPAAATELPTFAFLDTAGLATGILLRRPDPMNPLLDQMVVGDNRGGLLIYSRIGN